MPSLAKSFSVSGYAPLKELDARLKQADGKPVIVFHHSPSVDDFYRNQMHAGWKKDIREQWIALLGIPLLWKTLNPGPHC